MANYSSYKKINGSQIQDGIIDDNMINALNDPDHAECMAEERAQLKQEIQKARGW